MTDAINSNNRLKGPGPTADNRAKSPVESKAQSNESKPTASTVVELSSDQVMKEMQRLPEVNSSRIESIKLAIANGEYKPDPETIARKFSEIEKLLP